MDQSYEEDWDLDPYEEEDVVIKDEFDERQGPICFTEAETELILDRYVESYEIYHHTMTGGSREGVPAKKRFIARLTEEVNALGVGVRTEKQNRSENQG
ncbi:hypothetical protein COOONC_17721 [Cooperia oncophora]